MSVKKVQSLADFKQELGVDKLNVVRSKAGNLYAVDSNEELIAWVSDDIDFTAPMIVFSMQEGTDAWKFIANGEVKPRETVATI